VVRPRPAAAAESSARGRGNAVVLTSIEDSCPSDWYTGALIKLYVDYIADCVAYVCTDLPSS